MKVLLVMPYCPFPVRRGRDRLIKNLIDGLTARHHVTLATMTLSAEEEAALAALEISNFASRAMRAPNKKSTFHRALYKGINCARLAGELLPLQVSYARPAAFMEHLREVAREAQPDVVLANYWHLFDLPLHLESHRTALITHDVDFLIHAQRIRRMSSPFKKIFARAEAALYARIEKKAYANYGAIITLTKNDSLAIASEMGETLGRIVPLPLALDLDYFKAADAKREKDVILFFGALDADFNRDALHYFAGEVFPAVRKARPESRCEVVGHGLSDSLGRTLPSGMAYLGGVEDVRGHLARCACMALPLRFGGGVRIRMLEAAAMGTPVASTPLGVAGMGLAAGVEYLEGANAREMAESIIRLLENPGLARRIGGNARRWALANVSMEDYPDRLDEFLARLETSFSNNAM